MLVSRLNPQSFQCTISIVLKTQVNNKLHSIDPKYRQLWEIVHKDWEQCIKQCSNRYPLIWTVRYPHISPNHNPQVMEVSKQITNNPNPQVAINKETTLTEEE